MGLSSVISPVGCLWNPNVTGLTAWLINNAANLSPAALDSEILQCAQPCQSGAVLLEPDMSNPQTAIFCYCSLNGVDALLSGTPNNGTCGKLCGGTDATFTCGGLQGGVLEASVYTIL
ncbi:hypothetical protein HK101_001896, partial [Irineochytrium annulatum]